jgi:hypothetical protein
VINMMGIFGFENINEGGEDFFYNLFKC